MSYAAQFERCDLSMVFDLKGRVEDLQAWAGDVLPAWPTRPNSLTREGAQMLSHIGPEQWQLWDAIAHEDSWLQKLRPQEAPPEISIVRVSDCFAKFVVTGEDAGQIMAIACPLDLHRDVFAPDACSYTDLFGLKGCLWRCAGGFELAVDRSYGDMVEDYLKRALQ